MDKAFAKKIAKAARSPSADCVNGTAPKFGSGRPWIIKDGGFAPYCALGHVYHRAGLSPSERPNIPFDPDGLYRDEALVWWANDTSAEEDRHSAVVFPLLAFADALEAA